LAKAKKATRIGRRDDVPGGRKFGTRAAQNAVAAAAKAIGQECSRFVGLQLGQMGQQFILLR